MAASVARTRSPANEFALAFEVGPGALMTGAFGETLSTINNPFQASGASATDQVTAGKIRLQITHAFTPKLDGTVWAAGADSFGYTSPFGAAVSGIETFTPTRFSHPAWAEYGGRVGYKFTPVSVINLLFDGVSGADGIGTTCVSAPTSGTSSRQLRWRPGCVGG